MSVAGEGASNGRDRLRGVTLAALVVMAAFALRCWGLGSQSVWFDEGWSWHLARMALPDMAATTAADRSPALYYALLGGWIRLAGDAEFAMRFISALADTLTVALVIAFTRLLARRSPNPIAARSASLWPAIVYAACPFAVWYAQETRMYAQLAMLCLASSYCIVRWLVSDRRARWLSGWAVAFALALHSHYYAIFILPAQFLLVIFFARSSPAPRIGRRFGPLFQWLLALALVGLAFAPWALFSLGGFAYDDGFFFPRNTVPGRVLDWLRAFAGGGAGAAIEPWQAALFGVAIVLGLAAMLQAKQWRALVVVLTLTIVPLLAATTFVAVVFPSRSVFHPRYLIFLAPVACALLGGVWRLRPADVGNAAIRLAALAVAWLPALAAIHTDPALARDDVRAATRHVVEAIEPGDLVIMSRDNYAVRYYWRDPDAPLVAVPQGLHGVLRDDAPVLEALARAQPKRVRLMLWQDDVVDPQKFVESSLWSRGYQIGEYNLGRNRLPLYAITRPDARAEFKPVRASFDNALDLAGYWMSDELQAGWFYALLDWLPREQLRDYKVTVQALDSSGKVRFQQDKLALSDLLPTSRWTPGQHIRDAYAIVPPKDLSPGNYDIVVGLYSPDAPGARASAVQDGLPAAQNLVKLGTLRVP